MTADQSTSDTTSFRPLRDLIDIDVRRDSADAVVIQVGGELDRAAVPALASCLDQVLAADTRCTTLVIDLAETTFIDLGGLRLLLDTHERVSAAGTAFSIAGCGLPVLRILQVTQTAALVPLMPPQHADGGGAVPAATDSAAHTDLPSANSVTPQRVDRSATTCNPRPRGDRTSKGRGRGGGHR
jgi:anti-anti-sigma factor